MSTNEELKKKIVKVLQELRASKPMVLNDYGLQIISRMTDREIADALIAAGLKFDTVVSHTATFDIMQQEQISRLEIRVAEAEHRAEVAEKAGRIIQRDMARVFDISNPRVCELIANIWDLAKKQAEKELAEEGKE